MIYNYFFLISLIDIPAEFKNFDFSNLIDIIPQISLHLQKRTVNEILINDIIPKFENAYNNIIRSGISWFPNFGEIEYMDSQDWDVMIQNPLINLKRR